MCPAAQTYRIQLIPRVVTAANFPPLPQVWITVAVAGTYAMIERPLGFLLGYGIGADGRVGQMACQ